jgi:adenylate cyclase
MRADPDFAALHAAQTAMLAAYRARDWAAAEARLPEIADHGLPTVAQLYAERIHAFTVAPPPPDWDGVYDAKAK